VIAVNVPVFDSQGGVIAAISVSAISSRMEHTRQKVAAEILKKYQTEIRQFQKPYSLKTGTYRAKTSLWHYT
jgi:DNA-binding IclR family transcriptional regulator